MRIAIFGLGYVGSVSAACLAAAGHDVVGVDVDPHKTTLIRAGHPPVNEPGLDDLVGRVVAEGKLTVTDDAGAAVHQSELSLVCVGTPSRRNGSLDTTFLERVVQEIGSALARSASYHVVAVRSTVVPGVVSSRLLPMLDEASGRRVGSQFGFCVNPEFLREGSAIRDFEHPPFTVVGETEARAGEVLLAAYQHVNAPVYRMLPDEASMVKYASNMFHAVKVAFGNEVGALCQQLGMDGRTVMRVFCEDRDLNISPRYLLPGFGFGGSCLPKDLRAMVHVAKDQDLTLPLLSNVLSSNDAHIQRVVDTVLDMGKPRVALVGLSFKPGSDDLRESPFVRLAEALIGKGVPLRVYDPDVSIDGVFGRNRAYVQEHLPHVGQLMSGDFDEAIRAADAVIVGKHVPDLGRLSRLRRPNQAVIDLVGLPDLGDVVRPWSGVHTAGSAAAQ